MSLRIKSLNADTSFLLTFAPPYAGNNPPASYPGSFTVLLDPWLCGPAPIYTPKFAVSGCPPRPCIRSLAEIPDPDVILISQDKTDHCHQDTLLTLPSDTSSLILAAPGAAKKIRSWNHFDPSQVQSLKRFEENKEETIYRIPVPAFSPSGVAGEVTIAFLAPKFDPTGLRTALGITYRPPSTVLSVKTGSYFSLPMTPPTTPPSHDGRPRTSSSSATRLSRSSSSHGSSRSKESSESSMSPSIYREKTISAFYSPHGVPYSVVKPYAISHLHPISALPLTALFHSFAKVDNTWYLGGNIIAGAPVGAEVARNLYARIWVSAHDEDKEEGGVATKKLTKEKFTVDAARKLLDMDDAGRKIKCQTEVVQLDAGEEYFLAAR